MKATTSTERSRLRSFLRVTSRYSMARRHPVFGNTRPHQGIDYGALPKPH
ncbi:MAG: hypothetical protein ACLUDQ_08890 [Bilophila wadsworthia]